jgi:sugar-specific transcriptional regulator TrmB
MEWSKEMILLLGLKAKEVAILRALTGHELSIAELSEHSKIARMTLYPLLTRLRARGFIDYRRSGKRRLWGLVPNAQLRARFESAQSELAPHTERQGHTVRLSSEYGSELVFHRGVRRILDVVAELIRQEPNGVLKGIQSTSSGYRGLEKSGDAAASKINALIKKHKIIVEAVLDESFLHAAQKRTSSRWKKSYIGRMANTSIVPDEYLNFNADLFLFSKRALLINWHDEVAIDITNTEILKMLERLFDFMHASGEKVDTNALVREALQKK